MSDFSFTKRERIRTRYEFVTIYNKGEKRSTQHFIVFVYPNGLTWSRLGVTVSKKIGRAVTRNHVKRLLREYFRLHKHQLAKSSDILIVAKYGSNRLKYKDLCNELNDALIS